VKILSAKKRSADRHPLENPVDLIAMLIFVPGVAFVTVLVWAAS
jgi:hypothetical protein|tara:strand:- start:54533 stop:54664 length:132 start_codon:yes stop_codon:yes gene_type:complete